MERVTVDTIVLLGVVALVAGLVRTKAESGCPARVSASAAFNA